MPILVKLSQVSLAGARATPRTPTPFAKCKTVASVACARDGSKNGQNCRKCRLRTRVIVSLKTLSPYKRRFEFDFAPRAQATLATVFREGVL